MVQRTPPREERERTTLESLRETCVEWILLSGDRGLLALAFVAVYAAFFAALELLAAVPLLNTQALFYAYSGLIAGNLTLITVVVTINQLLLSRELRTPDEIQSQIRGVVEFREDVEESTDEVAPVKPMGFLRLLVEATREEAQRLGGFARDGVVPAGREEIEDVVTTLTEQMDEADHLLTESEAGTFSVLSTLLETNYAEQIHQLRALQATHEDEMADAAHESIYEFVDRLREIDVARQYFKSIYLQQELSELSRALLYAGLPAVAVAIATLLAFTVPTDTPSTAIDPHVLVLVTLPIGLLPIAILTAFFLRTATVMRLTAATLPFTTPEQER